LDLNSFSSSLEGRLGYGFRNPALLAQALTPPSAGLPGDNQRLEFLGDSVLHLCATLLVYREHPTWAEGALSKLRGLLVCTDALHAWAQDLGIILSLGPRSPRKAGAVQLRNPMADAVEALLAAVYLDAAARGEDALATVMAIVERRCLPEIQRAYPGVWEARDTKTTLQERAAVLALPPPSYELVERAGPDHAPSFRVRVRLGTQEATGSASTLKRAQAAAAGLLLKALDAPV
jgi:ribonuclease-3